MNSFVHLHNHTEYSMLDGAARIGDALDKAVKDGQPAMAITDHGNMYGVLDFYKEANKRGVNPIIGIEAYMAGGSRFERPARRGRVDDSLDGEGGAEKLYYHIILLAENNTGYKNLIKLASLAYLEGYYYKPRLDYELLEAHHEGIIATTGCLGGLVLQSLIRDDKKGAWEHASRLKDIFGPENLFVELQDHGLALQKKTNPLLIELARDLSLPLLATNDAHYTHKEDHKAHDALLCVQTGATMNDEKRFRFEGEEHYIKSAEEMRTLFAEVPEACDNTLEIGERCKVEIEFGKPKLPEFPVPERFRLETYEDSSAAYLRHLAYEGARRRYGEELSAEVVERLDYELSVIADMGFSAYFLVVWDLIRFAKEKGIRVGPGRGSAAGCCVAYCLNIVDLDPIRYDLLFERFLNPGRKQMPDIDMDFDERYRGDMIRYAAERYGYDHVAQIVTFSTIKARAAVRDASRVLGLPYALGDRIAKAMPPLVMGRDTPLHACFELTPGYEDGYKVATELREMVSADPDAKSVVEVALGLENLRRQDGIHAAAVVITHEPLTEYLPIQRKPDASASAESAPIVTQYEMHGVEELGLLKMDFLGLRTLSVIERALDLIQETTGVRPDIDKVDLADEKTLAMLRDADSIGVFQLEGKPMRALMRSLAPTGLEDVAALVALYRPGPMAANMHNDYADRKNGRKPIEYLHDDLRDILSDTYGLMIYQESVMRVAQKFAGYSLAEADNLRKACGKKIRELIKVEREKFVAGCVDEGYGNQIGTALFDIIEPFADYAFNKSHSYGYGLVAFQTAYLKANFPAHYLAALLTSVKDDKDKTGLYLADAKEHGIDILVPDVNESRADFFPIISESGSAIRFGLSGVRNVGEGVVGLVIAEREANGPYLDFADFLARSDVSVLNRRVMESLIRAGALDSFGHTRRGLLETLDATLERVMRKRKEDKDGIMGLFDSGAEEDAGGLGFEVVVPDLPDDRAALLSYEKEMLGLYVSDHPVAAYVRALSRRVDSKLGDLGEPGGSSSEVMLLGGVVTALSRRYTKRGELMASFVLEDLSGSIDVFVFPKTMTEYGAMLADDKVVLVKGRINQREDERTFVAMSIEEVEAPSAEEALEIRLEPGQATRALLSRIRSVLVNHPGGTGVLLRVGESAFDLSAELKVAVESGSLIGELREFLRPESLVL